MYSIFFSKIDKSFPLIKKRLKTIINPNDKVVVIPWSFAVETDALGVEKYFSGSKREKYINPLIDLGIKEANITVLNCYKDNSNEMIELIKESNILILPGGNPEMFYNKVIDCKLLDTIRNYKKIIIGESAGTELQLETYFITAKNNYYKKFDWYKGFGVIKEQFYLDVHSINDIEYLNQFKEIAKEKNKKVYAIFDDGVIIYNRNNNQIELYGNVLEFE